MKHYSPEGMMKIHSCIRVLLPMFLFSMTAGDILRVNAAYAAELPMPAVNQLVQLSSKYNEPTLRGIKVDPADPFKLTFVYDKGSEGNIDEKTATELAQYFFAALVTPTKDLWVNLSPFEKDRVIEDTVAQTEIGDVFLAQDFMLKQLSASLTDPATESGKAYWSALGSLGAQHAAPAASMSKIWITPGEIQVYSDKTNTIIADAQLDVRTEHDYLAAKNGGTDATPAGVQAVRDVVLPLVRKDVNEGKNFASLRQMMHAIILAQLFKNKYGASVYSALIDTGKDKGLETGDPAMKSNVFEKYASSFNNGVYRMTAKTRDAQGKKVKREYFSGGIGVDGATVTAASAIPSGLVATTINVEAKGIAAVFEGGVDLRVAAYLVDLHYALLGESADVMKNTRIVFDIGGTITGFDKSSVDAQGGFPVVSNSLADLLKYGYTSGSPDFKFMAPLLAARGVKISFISTATLEEIIALMHTKMGLADLSNVSLIVAKSSNEAYLPELKDLYGLTGESKTTDDLLSELKAVYPDLTIVLDGRAKPEIVKENGQVRAVFDGKRVIAIGDQAADVSWAGDLGAIGFGVQVKAVALDAQNYLSVAVRDGLTGLMLKASSSSVSRVSALLKDAKSVRDFARAAVAYSAGAPFGRLGGSARAILNNEADERLSTVDARVFSMALLDESKLKALAEGPYTMENNPTAYIEVQLGSEKTAQRLAQILLEVLAGKDYSALSKFDSLAFLTVANNQLSSDEYDRFAAVMWHGDKTLSLATSGPTVEGGIDLSNIVGKIKLEGTGDPWNGERLSSSAIAAITGVTLKAEGGFKPFVLTPVVAK